MVSTQNHQLNVFIVDDSPIVAERLLKLLVEINDVSVAGTALDIGTSLRLIKETQPNVVILDINLNDAKFNGTDLLGMLRKTYPDMIIIMFTNLTSTQYIKKCHALGANYFLDKSNEFEKIPKILSRIIGFRKSEIVSGI